MTGKLSHHKGKLAISVLYISRSMAMSQPYIMASMSLDILRLSLPSFAELPPTIVVFYTLRVYPHPTTQFLVAVLFTPL